MWGEVVSVSSVVQGVVTRLVGGVALFLIPLSGCLGAPGSLTGIGASRSGGALCDGVPAWIPFRDDVEHRAGAVFLDSLGEYAIDVGLDSSGFVVGVDPSGIVQYFGLLSAEGEEGTWVYFDQGRLWAIEQYVHGLREGTAFGFDEDSGEPDWTGEYIHDVLVQPATPASSNLAAE